MKVSSTCTLPPLADLLNPPRKPTSMALDVHSLLSPVPSSYSYHHAPSSYRPSYAQAPLKAKRKRASPAQLSVLNHIFSQTYFPSTELRIELGKQLGMSPRAVQIWFQNKRQSLRTRERQQQGKKPSNVHQQLHPCYGSPSTLPPISPPLSPPSWHPQHSYDSCPRPSHIALPPLQLPSTPSQSAYPSPTSIDSIILH